MQARLEAAGARAALEGALVEGAELESRRTAESAAADRGPSRAEAQAVAVAATQSLRHEVELRVAAEAARDAANATGDALRRACAALSHRRFAPAPSLSNPLDISPVFGLVACGQRTRVGRGVESHMLLLCYECAIVD